MKVSFATADGQMTAKRLLRLNGVLQGSLLKAVAKSAAKKRLKGFILEYEDCSIHYPPKEGAFTVEI